MYSIFISYTSHNNDSLAASFIIIILSYTQGFFFRTMQLKMNSNIKYKFVSYYTLTQIFAMVQRRYNENAAIAGFI